MITKLFEIRDSMTFIPVMATLMKSTHEKENYLLRRGNYRDEGFVLLTRLNDGKTEYNTAVWVNNRTMYYAHQHIMANFDILETGDVIDVEYLIGEANEPKQSERIMAFKLEANNES